MEEKKFCSHCGHEIKQDAIFCPYCGQRVDDDNTVNGVFESNPNTPSGNDMFHSSNNNANQAADNYETLTLVFGILSLVLGGLIWTILAFVFASKADKNDIKTRVGKGLAIAGVVIWSVFVVTMTIIQIIAISSLA